MIGKYLGVFCLIEFSVGFDVVSLKIKVEWKGDYYFLNGLKFFIINGGEVDMYIVFVKMNFECGLRGMSVFIVEKMMEGFLVGKDEYKMGFYGFWMV